MGRRVRANSQLLVQHAADSVTYALPDHGIEITAAPALATILEHFVDVRDLDDAARELAMSPELVSWLLSTFLLLPEDDAHFLERGFLLAPRQPVGHFVPWRAIDSVAPGTVCVVGAPFAFLPV